MTGDTARIHRNPDFRRATIDLDAGEDFLVPGIDKIDGNLFGPEEPRHLILEADQDLIEIGGRMDPVDNSSAPGIKGLPSRDDILLFRWDRCWHG